MKKLFNIYKNAIAMLTTYREMKLETPTLTFDAFASQVSHDEYIIIRAKCDSTNIRGATNNITIIVAPESDFATKSANFKKLHAKIEQSLHKDMFNNICFITETPLTSHINKITSAWTKDINMYVEDHVYDIFGFNPYMHNMVPKYKIVNLEWFFEQYYTSETSLPIINSRDAAAVWIGARPGFILEDEHLSVNTGYASGFFLCESEKVKEVDEEL
jgi:DNA-directed RNA polymerase subunit H (RpoH/RPB5)